MKLTISLTLLFLLPGGLSAQSSAPEFTIDTLAGTLNLGDGGPAAQALLSRPSPMATDRDGNILFFDSAHGRIRRISAATGQIDTIAGNGAFGAAGNGGPAVAAEIGDVAEIATGADGTVYFSDFAFHTIRAIDPGGSIRLVAGAGLGSSGDGGPAVQARFNRPYGLAVDASGNLVVADSQNNRIRRITPAGTVSTIVGTGTRGYNGPNVAGTNASVNRPSRLLFDPAGNLVFLDFGNDRIRSLDGGGTVRDLVDANPVGGTRFGLGGLARAADGSFFVSEFASGIIRQIRPDGGVTVAVAAGSAGTDGLSDLAIGAGGAVVFTDLGNHRILRLQNGTVTTIAGRERRLGDRASTAEISGPSGIDVDPSGNVYFVSQITHQAFRVDSGGGLRVLAGNGRPGNLFRSNGTEVPFNSPAQLSWDGGDLYIADSSNDSIRKIDSAGRLTTAVTAVRTPPSGAVATNDLFAPAGVTASGGTLWLTSTEIGRILRFENRVVTTVATAGNVRLLDPTSIVRDPAGNLYFCETGAHSIRMLTPAGDLSTLVGTGAAGFSGDGGPANRAQLSAPRGLAIDRNGNLYVADTGNHRVRMILRAAGAAATIVTIAGSGEGGFSGDGGRGASARLSNPLAVAVDAMGKVYIADTNNHRIRVLTQGAARFSAAGLVNSASFRASSATPGGLFTLFGTELASRIDVNTAATLPNALAGTAVELTDARATTHVCGMVSVTPGQISFVVPAAAVPGGATLRVLRDGAAIGSAAIQVETTSPGLFSAAATGRGVAAAVAIRVAADGTQTQVPVFTAGDSGLEAAPIDLGGEGDQIILLLFGTGIRGQRSVSVTAGGQDLTVLGAAAQGQFAGLDQINVVLAPALAGRGEIEIVATVDGKQSNTVTIHVR